MNIERVTGRTVVVGDEIYKITSDAQLPRCYVIAGLVLLVNAITQLFLSPANFGPVLYALAMAGAALLIAWLFDDRSGYRMTHVANLSMPNASDGVSPNAGNQR